jgi:hypothetical protein
MTTKAAVRGGPCKGGGTPPPRGRAGVVVSRHYRGSVPPSKAVGEERRGKGVQRQRQLWRREGGVLGVCAGGMCRALL